MVPKLTTLHEIKACKKLQTVGSACRATDYYRVRKISFQLKKAILIYWQQAGVARDQKMKSGIRNSVTIYSV
jgi:hypothetical protein